MAISSAEEGCSAWTGVTKIHGRLVPLRPLGADRRPELRRGAAVGSDGMTLRVRSLESDDGGGQWPLRPREAEMIFRFDEGLTVGYRGFYARTGAAVLIGRPPALAGGLPNPVRQPLPAPRSAQGG